MEIKKLANTALNFSINRFIEILSICITVIGVLLLISLISFSPDDPNFIFPESTTIKNLLGYHGSFSADFFFQSFGLISLLVPFSLIFTGFNIFLNKRMFLLIHGNFFATLYLLCGSLFFSIFYSNAFELHINGNGGFVGKYLETTFLNLLINLNPSVAYYFLLFLIVGFFLVSVQKKYLISCFLNRKKIIHIKMK